MSIHVAAVDLGATSGRVMRAVVGADSLELIEVARFPNGPVTSADGLHWDIEALRGHVLAGLRQAFADDPLITSIGIDSWAVDYALMAGDRMLGTPFHYRDDRSARGVAAVHAVVPPDELYAASGLQHLSFTTVFQLAAEGEALAEADRFLMIPDLFSYWLTGRSVVEVTNASTTALLDPTTREWNDDLIALLGLPRAIFSELIQPGAEIGALTPSMAAELSAPVGLRVVAVGSHDTASAVVGVPMTRPDAAYISCGTWGLVGLELEHPVITDTSRGANFTNEGGVDGRVRFLHNVMGLWLLSETMRAWEAESGPVDLAQLLLDAEAVTEAVPIFDANDERFMAPGDMPARIAAILAEHGDVAPADRAAFARCIIESLAAAFAEAVRDAGRLAHREIGVIHLVGGGALNSLLCQLTADRARMPVLAGPVEATAIGNVLVQARALGLGGTLEHLRTLVARVYPPQTVRAARLKHPRSTPYARTHERIEAADDRRDTVRAMSSVLDRPGIVLGVAALVLNDDATDDRARAVVTAAVEGGAVALDTARAYASVDDDGVGERLASLGRTLRAELPIVTKAGHYRVSASAWNSDGSEARLRADATRSAELLGQPLALLLLHRADRVDDLEQSVRTLAALRDEGVARAIGLSNASIELIDRALAVAPIDAVQNRLGLGVDSFDEYRHCRDLRIDFFAFAPFGGPRAAPLATRVPRVSALATSRGQSVHRLVLAAVLDALPGLWPVVGPTRVESVRDAMAAMSELVNADLRRALVDDLASRGVPI